MRHTLTELTGPVYGHETVRENDHDLTIQHKGEPLGERIIVHGQGLDGRGVPNVLVELWQATLRWPLCPRGRPASGAAFDPTFHWRGTRAIGCTRLLQVHHE